MSKADVPYLRTMLSLIDAGEARTTRNGIRYTMFGKMLKFYF